MSDNDPIIPPLVNDLELIRTAIESGDRRAVIIAALEESANYDRQFLEQDRIAGQLLKKKFIFLRFAERVRDEKGFFDKVIQEATK